MPEQTGSENEAIILALRNTTPTTLPFFSSLIVPHISPGLNKEGLTHYYRCFDPAAMEGGGCRGRTRIGD